MKKKTALFGLYFTVFAISVSAFASVKGTNPKRGALVTDDPKGATADAQGTTKNTTVDGRTPVMPQQDGTVSGSSTSSQDASQGSQLKNPKAARP